MDLEDIKVKGQLGVSKRKNDGPVPLAGSSEIHAEPAPKKVRGVCWEKRGQKWTAQIRIGGKITHLGGFDDEENAARKYDEHAAHLGRPLNFTSEGQAQAKMSMSSKFRGVHWNKRGQKWKAEIRIDGKQTHLGLFDNEKTAARKFDEHAARLGRLLNFPSEGQAQATIGKTSNLQGAFWNTHLGRFDNEDTAARKYVEHTACLGRPLNPPPEGQEQATMGKSSKFRGVSWIKRDKKWLAQITIDGKLKHLGYFDDDETAARKYDEHAARLGRPLNSPPEGQAQAMMDKSSRFRGVSWYKQLQKWKANVSIDGKTTHLGYFDNEESAAQKYDEHAARHGRNLNFPTKINAVATKDAPPHIQGTSMWIYMEMACVAWGLGLLVWFGLCPGTDDRGLHQPPGGRAGAGARWQYGGLSTTVEPTCI